MPVLTTPPLPAAVNDEQLLERFRAGDRAALDEVFRHYRALAYRVAHRLLGNEADALDAVQEGFVKALTHLAGFRGRSSFKTWLLRIVSNAALDLGRQRGRREALPLAAVWERDLPTERIDPGRSSEGADVRRLIDEALAALPEAQRRTFVLHVDGEMSYREVAEALGISIGTVMSRLFYARQKLRALLDRRLKP
jgi:RNA polymerase sigma-70 factor, ECF subfamily